MCPPNCACIRCTLVFGQQLASLIHTWSNLTSKADGVFSPVVNDITASTAALEHLHMFMENDDGSAAVFTAAGRREVETLAVKCNLIFKALILLVERAAERARKEDEKDHESGGDGEKEEKRGLLAGPVPSLTSTKTLGFILRLSGQWDWLDNRITPCQVQLRWASIGLLLHSQMGRLTAVVNQPGSQGEDGSFDSQLIVRASVLKLRASHVMYVKSKARVQERAEKRAKHLREARERFRRNADADAVSVHRSSSRASGSTMFVDEDPETGPAEKVEHPGLVALPECPLVPAPAASSPADAAGTPTKPAELTHNNFSKDDASVRKPRIGIQDMSSSLSATMSAWTHKIFGKEDQFSKDWESQELEAWVIRSAYPFSTPMKVPFGHQRLRYGLKKTKSKKAHKLGLTTFGRYVEEGFVAQVLIDEVVREANRLQSRARVFLTFADHKGEDDDDVDTSSSLLAFFSIRDEKAPIFLTDCIGRKMRLPYETCKTWEGMAATMTEAFRNIPGLGQRVVEQHWGVQTANGENILPAHWQSIIKPGDSIFMKMHPEHPVLVQRKCYGNPPYAPPLRETSDRLAASMRQDRLERVHLANGRPPFGLGRGPHLPGVTSIPSYIPYQEREAWVRKQILQLHQQQQQQKALMSIGFPQRPAPTMSTFGGWVFQPGRPPTVAKGIHVIKSAPSVTTVDKDDLTEEEKTELTFVNFMQERRKATGETAADLLARFTELRDISGCFEDGNYCISSDSSCSDSYESSSESDYSNQILDD